MSCLGQTELPFFKITRFLWRIRLSQAFMKTLRQSFRTYAPRHTSPPRDVVRCAANNTNVKFDQAKLRLLSYFSLRFLKNGTPDNSFEWRWWWSMQCLLLQSILIKPMLIVTIKMQNWLNKSFFSFLKCWFPWSRAHYCMQLILCSLNWFRCS